MHLLRSDREGVSLSEQPRGGLYASARMDLGFSLFARIKYAMRCTNTLVLPEPGPASTSTFEFSLSSVTMERWLLLLRLSTMRCQDSGVVCLMRPRFLPGNHLSKNSLLGRLK